jgi:hypothetical protein
MSSASMHFKEIALRYLGLSIHINALTMVNAEEIHLSVHQQESAPPVTLSVLIILALED